MKHKVLFVQKGSEFTQSCLDAFEKKGWEAELCVSGISAVGRAQVWKPDLVVIGDDIEDCQPFTVIKNILAAPIAKISVIFIGENSFYKRFKSEVEKWEDKISGWLQMPVSSDQLCEVCDAVVSEKGLDDFKNICFSFSDLEEVNQPKDVEKPQRSKRKEAKPVLTKNENVKKKAVVKSKEQDTLKKYVAIQEKEIAEFQEDLNRAKEQLDITQKRADKAEFEYKKLVQKSADFHKKVELLSQENDELRKRHQKELKSREQEARTKSDKILMIERKLDMAQKREVEMKERVKRDIQQIRVKEKDLEAKLEIIKRDSETLLSAKDRKLLEMKRKIDGLDYEIESLKEKEEAAQKKVKFWKDRIERVLRALKMGTSLLETEDEEFQSELEETLTSIKKSHKVA